MTYTMGSLFAGIGGFDLGFERAGFKTVWQVEIDPYCQKVLAKNFPEAGRFGDIRECGRHNLKSVDVICGGFPCQDISNAGKRAGIEGERSGLWSEMHRIIRELRPAYVLVENVAALLGRGMGVVLGDLAEIGYDAEWEVVSAADMGAPHLRERVWIMAYTTGPRCGQRKSCEGWPVRNEARRTQPERRGGEMADAESIASNGIREDREERCGMPPGRRGSQPHMANPTRIQQGRQEQWTQRERVGPSGEPICALANPECESTGRRGDGFERWQRRQEEGTRDGGPGDWSANDWWLIEPNVGRVAHGIPKRVDRLRGLGNAVVPQIPEMIARRIKQALEAA
jgi:DNA (cytosine-5)-methyltransferase 1